MDISTSISTDLSAFLIDLDPAGPDVLEALAGLRRDLVATVPSFQGLRLVLQFDGTPIALTLADGSLPPVTTLRLQLWWLSTDQGASSITFFAAVPGAFVDLAADLSYGLRLPEGVITLDQSSRAVLSEVLASGLSGLSDLTALNRAIGMLLEHGYTEVRARAELNRRAAASGRSLIQEAELQVASWPRQD